MKQLFKKFLIGIPIVAISTFSIMGCSIKENKYFEEVWEGKKDELVTTISNPNGNVLQKWFATVGAFTNLASTVGLNDVQPRLLSTWYYDFLDNNPNKKFKKYYKLRLAQSITIKYKEKNKIIERTFDRDGLEDAATNDRNINHISFKKVLSSPQVQNISFKLRDSNWIDHKGNKTQFKIINKDFLTGFRFNLLKFIPSIRYTLSKTHKQKITNEIKSKGLKSILEFETRFSKKVAANYFTATPTDNRYLLDISGLNWQDFFGIDTTLEGKLEYAKLVNEESIAPSNKKDILNFSFKSSETKADIFLDSLTNDHSNPFSAIASKYAENLPVDNYSLPKDDELGKMGFYKYGRTFKETLFASPYYISRNEESLFQVKKNNYYGVKEIREKKGSVQKHTTFIVKSIDNDTKSIQNWNRFDVGVDYIINADEFEGLSEKRKIQVYQNHKNIIKKRKLLNPKQTNNQILWDILPLKNYTKPTLWNDGFAKMMYGKTKNELSQKNSSLEIYKHIVTKGAVFRSLIHGVVNWQTFIAQAYKGNGTYWPFLVADGSTIGIKNQTAYDRFKSKNNSFVDIPLLIYKNNKIKMQSIDGIKNYEKTIKTEDNNEAWKSYKYLEIKNSFKELVESIYGKNKKIEIKFDLPLRGLGGTSKSTQLIYRNVANTIESLSSKNISVKIEAIPGQKRDNYNPKRSEIINSLTTNTGSHNFHGWSSDFVDAFGMWAGKLQINNYGSNAWLRLLSYFSKGEKKLLYPNTTKMSNWFAKKYENYMSELKDEIKEKGNIFIKDYAKNKDEIFTILDKPFKNILDGDFEKSAKGIKSLNDILFNDKQIEKIQPILLKKIDSLVKVTFKRWVTSIQDEVFNNDENSITNVFREIDAISGLPMQIDRKAHFSNGASARTQLVKKWINVTPDKSDFNLISEWQIIE